MGRGVVKIDGIERQVCRSIAAVMAATQYCWSTALWADRSGLGLALRDDCARAAVVPAATAIVQATISAIAYFTSADSTRL
jgi:hypothetical protein